MMRFKIDILHSKKVLMMKLGSALLPGVFRNVVLDLSYVGPSLGDVCDSAVVDPGVRRLGGG